jgi:holo-[acyl-carrier protein] synthase
VIVGVGVDVVDIERFAATLDRTPGIVPRVLTDEETVAADGSALGTASLAARFAAKEAVAKVLGAPAGLAWHDCQVLRSATGRPELHVRGTVAAAAHALGIARWHVSLSHDGGVAVAQVVGESA